MQLTDRTVSVRVQARVDQYTAAMQRVAKSTHDASKSADRDLQYLGSRMQGIGTKLSLGLSLPLAYVAKQAVGFASAAHETTNKVEQAFGQNAAAIRAWSKDAARSMGLSQQEAQTSAASFGTMFKEMGLGSSQVLDMSKNVVQLAGDLGSFWDVDPSEMLDNLRSGVVGEIEPLRRFGILLSDQAVRSEAVKLGLAATTQEVSEQAKVQARYALILDQTGTAQGDYARTADGTANSMRTATAAYKDAMAELGDNLLPLVAKGAQTFADFAEAFGRMPEAGQSVLLGVGGFAALLGPAVFLTGGLIRNLQTIQQLGPGAATALKWGGVAAGIGAVSIAVGNLADQVFKVRTNGTGLASELADIASGLAANNSALSNYASDRSDDLELLANDIKTFSDASVADKVAHTIEYLIPGKGPDRIHEATTRLDELDKGLVTLASSGSADAAAQAVENLVLALASEGVTRDDLIARLPQYAALLEQQGIAEQFAGDAASGANDKLSELADTTDELMNRTFGVQGASEQLATDMLDLAQAVRDAKAEGNGFATSLDATSIEGLKNRSLLQGMANDALDLAQQMADMGQSPVAAMAAVRDRLIDTAVQLGFNRGQAADFFDVLLQVGNLKVTPSIGLDTNPARRALQDLLDTMEESMKAVFGAFGVDTSTWNHWAVPAEVPGALGSSLTTGVGNVTSGLSAPSGGSTAPVTTADERMANRYEFGGISAEDYKKYLEDRLRSTEQFSNEWMAIWRQIQQVNQDIGAGWTAAQEERQRLEDLWMETLRREHEVGDLSTKEYLKQLEKRLEGLQKYSDEWMEIWREIHQLKDDISQEQIDIIAAVDKQRQYDEAFYGTVSQRNLQAARDTGTVVVQGASSRVFSPNYTITTPDATSFQTNQRMRDDAFLASL